MAFRNAENLGIYPMQAILKIGDTIADIEEGKNAGMWSVGVVNSSNELGLTEEDFEQMDPKELETMKQVVRNSFFEAGADYVIDSLSEIENLIILINNELAEG
jgi:phosphonoacetaldehyde hydrolase